VVAHRVAVLARGTRPLAVHVVLAPWRERTAT